MGDQDFHSRELLEHCRVCGDSVLKQRTHTCTAHLDQLYRAFRIDVRDDQQHIHPPRFCHRCYSSMTRVSLSTTLNLFQWAPHSDPECRVRQRGHALYLVRHSYTINVGVQSLQYNPPVRAALKVQERTWSPRVQ